MIVCHRAPQKDSAVWVPAVAGTTTDRTPPADGETAARSYASPAQPYFVAEKRLSKELGETIGWAPATIASLDGAADGSEEDWLSAIDGLRAGGLAACLASAGLAATALDFASAAFGLAGAGAGGGVVAVVSAVAPPRPILWARLAK